MLVSEYVEVILNPSNISHFKSLNYNIPTYIDKQNRIKIKKGTKILVKVSDLPSKSSVMIDVYCDDCLKNGIINIIQKRYVNYCRDYKKNLKDVCFNCGHKIGAEKQKETYKDILNVFKSKNLKPLFTYDEYTKCEDKLPFICLLHENYETQYISYTKLKNTNQGCIYCSKERWTQKYSKENNPNWRGGISNTANYLRGLLKQWITNNLQLYNYKCVLTGYNGNLEIHHLYGFDLILQEVIEKLNFKLKGKINEYTIEQLKCLESIFIETHNNKAIGICLHPKIHKLFHKLYGRGKNTPEQFNEFINRLLSNEFSQLLEQNKLKIKVNDRICQFRIQKKMPTVTFNEVEYLNNKDRNGFGSTGRA